MAKVLTGARRGCSGPAGADSRWVRRRHYIEAGYIKPVPGAAVRAYNPMVGHPGEVGPLHIELAALNVRDALAVEAFASTWGVLGPDQRGQPVEEFSLAAEEFRRVYLAATHLADGRISEACPSAASSGEAAWLQTMLAEHMRGVQPVPRLKGEAEAEAECSMPGASGWALDWELPSLLSGAYLLLFLDLKEGYRARLCANETCGRPFTTDRSDRIYCTARCSDNQKQRVIRRRAAAQGTSMAAVQRRDLLA